MIKKMNKRVFEMRVLMKVRKEKRVNKCVNDEMMK